MGLVRPEEHVFILLSKNVQQIMSENAISLSDILARIEVVAPSAREVADPARKNDIKDLSTVILASSAAIAAITPLIVNIIKMYTHRPIVVEDADLIVLRDKAGNAIEDDSGMPILYWKIRKRLLEPKGDPSAPKSSATGFGIEFDVG